MSKTVIKYLKGSEVKSIKLALLTLFTIIVYIFSLPVLAKPSQDAPKITAQQARALQMLNQQQPSTRVVKNLRLKVKKIIDSHGQVYLGAYISRAELLPYLTQLKDVLQGDFEQFRANQSARDRHSFHMTLITPNEYQHVDKKLVEQLLSANAVVNFSSALQVDLLGLGKAEKSGKSSYFVVTQSNDAQLIRQRFLLSHKDFHITLGFNPNDVYGVRKDKTTLLNP